MYEHPGIKEVVSFGMKHERLGEEVVSCNCRPVIHQALGTCACVRRAAANGRLTRYQV
eukprot:COSAG01_NODE_659_length_14436_cov_15.108112_5_plen_58_part_00